MDYIQRYVNDPQIARPKVMISIGLGVLSAIAVSMFGKGEVEKPEASAYNPCCAYPCENKGICIDRHDKTYYCDCTGTGHYGLNCERAYWSTAILKFLKPSPEASYKIVTSYGFFWDIVNKITPLQRMIMQYIYLTRGDIVDSPALYDMDHSYITLDAFFNETYYARTLPRVPEDCPTPMGIKGPRKLPDVKVLFEKVFKRRTFIPEPHDTNLLFQYFAQHFTHQFFRTNYKTDGQVTLGTTGVDASNVYGLNEETRRGLRSFVDGKLKTQLIQGEEFPPYLKDVTGVKMDYPPDANIPETQKFALGHPFFAFLPGLFVYATIWLREHNRVCDVLKSEHPHWDDERLYHTGRLIITGEIIKIVIEDYVQHLSQYRFKLTFDPEVIHGTKYQFHNRIHAEFDHLYHWHSLVPDGFNISGVYYPLMDMIFSTESVFKHGIDTFIDTMTFTRAGALGARNHPAVLEPVFARQMIHSRKNRLPGFNQYKKRWYMSPYKTFQDLTGENDLARDLEELYHDVDAVEYFVGLMSEWPSSSVTTLTTVDGGGPYSIKGLISNPICSPRWWKPSTFGGEVGFNIIKTATLKKLFCANMKTKCKRITFKVPEGAP